VLKVVTVPVLAAGGISSARAMAAALAAGGRGPGRDAVCGYRRVWCPPDYVAALLAPHAEAHPDEVVAMLQTPSGSQPIPLWFVATPNREVTGACRGHGAVRGAGIRTGHPGGPSRPGNDGVG
jgi:hypothetical protein